MPQELLEQLYTYEMLDNGVMTTSSSYAGGRWVDTTAEDKALLEREIRAAWKRWRRSLH